MQFSEERRKRKKMSLAVHDFEVKDEVRKEIIQQLDEITRKFGMSEWTLIMFKADGSNYEVVSNFTDILSMDVFRGILYDLFKQSQTILNGPAASA